LCAETVQRPIGTTTTSNHIGKETTQQCAFVLSAKDW
jgi:hypothetical protein